MDRREFLRLSSSSLVLLGGGLASATETKSPVLVVVFQRGAADALHMVVPYRDRRYRELRGPLALEEPGRGENPTLDLGGGFAFHPALSPLYPLYKSGRLAAIVNVGSSDPTRSHFDAQDYMESGTPGRKSTRDGWLTRALNTLDSTRQSPFAAVALASQMPRSLAGAPNAIALENFERLDRLRREDVLFARIERLYGVDKSPELARAGEEAFRALRLFREKDPFALEPSPGAHYPARGNQPLQQLAQLLKADLGIRIAVVESGGWDTHFGQGGATGQMANLMQDVSEAIAAFLEDVGHAVSVSVLTVTEFGRTVAPNGAGGTDHGHGGAMLVAGSNVRGGRVYGDWLGLDKRNLYDGRDLPVTTDFRDLFFEVAATSLDLPETSELFPGYRPRPLGVMG